MRRAALSLVNHTIRSEHVPHVVAHLVRDLVAFFVRDQHDQLLRNHVFPPLCRGSGRRPGVRCLLSKFCLATRAESVPACRPLPFAADSDSAPRAAKVDRNRLAGNPVRALHAIISRIPVRAPRSVGNARRLLVRRPIARHRPRRVVGRAVHAGHKPLKSLLCPSGFDCHHAFGLEAGPFTAPPVRLARGCVGRVVGSLLQIADAGILGHAVEDDRVVLGLHPGLHLFARLDRFLDGGEVGRVPAFLRGARIPRRVDDVAHSSVELAA